MKREKGLVLNVGTPSVLLILLVFTLTIFSLLSIRVSNHEWNLAQKTSASVTEYYAADQKAEYLLCKIDSLLAVESTDGISEKLTELKNAKEERLQGLEHLSVDWQELAMFSHERQEQGAEIGTISYGICIRENATLQVKLSILDNRTYEIEAWNMEQEALDVFELEGTLDLWDGNPLGKK